MSARLRPMASSRDQPKIASAWAFHMGNSGSGTVTFYAACVEPLMEHGPAMWEAGEKGEAQ